MNEEIEYIDPLVLYRWDEKNVERSMYVNRRQQYYDVSWDVEKPALTFTNILNTGKPHSFRLFVLFIILRISVLLFSKTIHTYSWNNYTVSYENRGSSVYILFGTNKTDYDVMRYVYQSATGKTIPNDWIRETKDYLGDLRNKSVAPDEDSSFSQFEENY